MPRNPSALACATSEFLELNQDLWAGVPGPGTAGAGKRMECCLWESGYEGLGGAANGNCRRCENGGCGLLGPGEGAPKFRSLTRGERLNHGAQLKLWTVLEGIVALCTLLPDGRRQVVGLSTRGDIFCPPDQLQGLEIWIEALACSEVCEFDLSSRRQVISDNATLSAGLFRLAQEQVTAVYTHLVTLGRLDGMERVCLFLADMAWRIGEETAAGMRVRLPLAREDIADYLGLNAETVSRIFSRVKKAKLADFHSPTEYTVRDLEALQSRAPILAPHGRNGRDRENMPKGVPARTEGLL